MTNNLPELYNEEARVRKLLETNEATADDIIYYNQIAEAICEFTAIQTKALLFKTRDLTESELSLISARKVKFQSEPLLDVNGNPMLDANGNPLTVSIDININTKAKANAKADYQAVLSKLNFKTNQDYFEYCQKNGLPNPISHQTKEIYTLNEDAAVAAGIGKKIWCDESKVNVKGGK